MGRAQHQQKISESKGISNLERLILRVSAMVNSHQAQLRRAVVIHRNDSDEDASWEEVIQLLRETDDLSLTILEGGEISLSWEQSDEPDVVESPPVEEETPF